MKINLQHLPFSEFSYPEIMALSYETISENISDETGSSANDFNITLYKNSQLLNWVQLCPGKNYIEFRNRYINNGDECSEISEKVLHYAEKWAKAKGYEKILIRACYSSLPYYLRMQYIQQGSPVPTEGNVLYPIEKML